MRVVLGRLVVIRVDGRSCVVDKVTGAKVFFGWRVVRRPHKNPYRKPNGRSRRNARTGSLTGLLTPFADFDHTKSFDRLEPLVQRLFEPTVLRW